MRIQRAHERMCWLLDRIDKAGGFAVAWDAELVDAFVDAFPEAESTLKVYTLGSNVSPMLNRAAQRAQRLGYLRAGKIGCQDARSYNRRTWARTWRIVLGGWKVKEVEK